MRTLSGGDMKFSSTVVMDADSGCGLQELDASDRPVSTAAEVIRCFNRIIEVKNVIGLGSWVMAGRPCWDV